MDLQYKKIVENFRLSIRRKQINSIFQKQRAHNLRQMEEQFKENLNKKLIFEVGKQAWLYQIAAAMSGEPSQQWAIFIRQLFYKIYDYREDHEQWVKLSIIKSVCDLFKPQHLHLRLSKIAANIITDILYINSGEPPNESVIKAILKYQFQENVISLMIQNADIEYIRLVGALFQTAPAIRNHFITNRLIQFLQSNFQKMEGSYEQISHQYMHGVFYLIQQILKVHQFDKDTFSKPKKSTIINLLPILSKQIQKNHTINNIVSILNSLQEVYRLTKNQILQQVAKYPNLIRRPIQMLNSTYEKIRYKSAKLLTNSLMVQNSKYLDILFDEHILDRIFKAYKMNDNKNVTRFMLLSLLSNISSDLEIYQQKVLYHPIMEEIIIKQAFDSYDSQIRKEAVYNICNILWNIQQRWFDRLMLQLKLFDVLVANIHRQDRDPNTVIDILSLWTKMIEKQQQEGGIQNRYYSILINYYNIIDMLSQIKQSDELEEHINMFMDFMENLHFN